MSKSVVWLDHEHADIFTLSADASIVESSAEQAWDYEHIRLHDNVPHEKFRMHARKNKNAGRFSPDEHKFYEAIETAVKGSSDILVIGPGFAKTEFVKHAFEHFTRFGEKLCGVETVDHPTARQLVHFTRDYFEVSHEEALEHLHVLAHKHSATH